MPATDATADTDAVTTGVATADTDAFDASTASLLVASSCAIAAKVGPS